MAERAEEVTAADEIERGMSVFSRRSLEQAGREWTPDDFGSAARLRLYRATVGAVPALARGRAAAVEAGIAAGGSNAEGTPAAEHFAIETAGDWSVPTWAVVGGVAALIIGGGAGLYFAIRAAGSLSASRCTCGKGGRLPDVGWGQVSAVDAPMIALSAAT